MARRRAKKPDTFLKDELDFLMRYEFSDVTTYKKILEAIAFGKNTPKEIRDYIKVKHSDLTPYLSNLIETGFVVRRVPVTECVRSKKGRYYISDNFVAFWFRYVNPNLSAIEEGIFDIDEVRRDYPNYIGSVFEEVAKQFLIELNKRKMLPFRFSKIGSWWHKDEEIDLIALNDKEKKALFVEVKWSVLREKDVDRILKDLEKRAEKVGLDDFTKFYGIVAKRVEGKGNLIWDLRDFSKIQYRCD